MAEKKFLDFLDRFDGGGMGKSGEKFEGGGLLSMLGNLFADPYGSDDKDRMASRDAFYGSQDIGGPAMRSAPAVIDNNQAVSARPAPGYLQPKTLDPQTAPLTKMSDIPGPFNPANVAPSQPNLPLTKISDIPGYTTPANNYVDPFAGDSFSYNGNRDAGMTGLIPTETNRYDFVNSLPDDARDFKNINLQGSGITPNNNYPDPRKLFAAEVAKFAGISPQEAETAINAGGFDQAYQAFVANNYKLPNS